MISGHGHGEGERSGARARAMRAGALVIALLVAFALGRMAGGGGGEAPEPPPAASAPVPSSPPTPAPRITADRSRRGAADAAGSAMSALAHPELLVSPARRAAVVADIATPSYRSELQALFDGAYEHMAGVLGRGRASGAVMRLIPLGHRIESYSPRSARVAVWQVLLLGAPGGRVVASWSTSRADLVWSDGRWRVAGFDADEPGPEPAPTTDGVPTPPEVFAARIATLEPFE